MYFVMWRDLEDNSDSNSSIITHFQDYPIPAKVLDKVIDDFEDSYLEDLEEDFKKKEIEKLTYELVNAGCYRSYELMVEYNIYYYNMEES